VKVLIFVIVHRLFKHWTYSPNSHRIFTIYKTDERVGCLKKLWCHVGGDVKHENLVPIKFIRVKIWFVVFMAFCAFVVMGKAANCSPYQFVFPDHNFSTNGISPSLLYKPHTTHSSSICYLLKPYTQKTNFVMSLWW